MEQRERKLYDIWAGRDPRFEVRHEDAVIRKLSDYGVGANELVEAKGKILGAGYEVYILAFFIGLYANKRMKLCNEVKKFGQPIQYWGNLDSKKGRKAYPKIREYMFAAVIAKTDVDFIALDKGAISVSEVANQLLQTMNEYANYGFYVIDEKLQNNPNHFYNQQAFFDLIWELTHKEDVKQETENQLEEW